MDKKSMQQKIGSKIRQVRLEKEITQEELATSIGKLREMLQRIESGSVNPRIYMLREIAGGLGIPLEELLKGL